MDRRGRDAAPLIEDEGRYADNPGGRQIRVYTRVDARLMQEDLIAKLRLSARAGA